jgi:predicted ATP-grasp superfamily ATP-dependent carboligase
LPISDIAHKNHLFSKIGLSIALSNSTVPTPKYAIVKSSNDLANTELNLSFPIIIKGDRSSSGSQTFRFNSQRELLQFKFEKSFFPAIVQEFISGQLISIEAFFHQKDLIYFQYSEVIRNVQNSEFTPSNLRRFFHTSNLNQEVEENLVELGRTLGADGFINIGCILSNDNKLSFFEADMRPNVWIDYGKFWGEDASEKISRKFSTLNINFSFPQKFDNEKIILGCPHRLPLIDIFLNRYKSCFILKHHTFELHLLLRKFRHFLFSIINLRFLRSFFKKLSLF